VSQLTESRRVSRDRGERLEQSQADLDRLQRLHAELDSRYSGSQKEVEDLRTKLQIQEQALTQAMARLEQANLSLSDLQDDYGDLRLKYDELVKPARSAEGRYVVEVRVSKQEGVLITQFRESKDDPFQRLYRAELEEKLAELKARHEHGLYVRVIIPDDSGLSYNEAWAFTSEIHSKFDYYFQDSAQ
jgi:chromosome segregation ATPase